MQTVHAGIRKFMLIAGQPVRSRPEIPMVPGSIDDKVFPVEVTTTEILLYARKVLREVADRLKSDECKGSERAFRGRLVLSETAERCQALAAGDLVELADASADITYTVVGTDIQFGIPSVAVFDEVQRSNEAKFFLCKKCSGLGHMANGPDKGAGDRCPACDGHGLIAIKDSQGKVQKPFGWSPPNIEAIITRAKQP